MKVMTGTVVGGKVDLPAEFVAEGSQVMVLAPEPDQPIHLSPAEEEELSAAMEDIRRGDFVDGQDLLAEIRSRRRR